MNTRNRLITLALASTLAAVGLVGSTGTTAGAASARSCYGDAWSYSKPSGTYFQPQSTTYFATENCADINIKTGTSRKVKVCFYASGGGLDYCQSSYKTTTAGEWKVIATDVIDGTKFKFQFDSLAASSGQRAH
jgi:hypothetical protein